MIAVEVPNKDPKNPPALKFSEASCLQVARVVNSKQKKKFA